MPSRRKKCAGCVVACAPGSLTGGRSAESAGAIAYAADIKGPRPHTLTCIRPTSHKDFTTRNARCIGSPVRMKNEFRRQ